LFLFLQCWLKDFVGLGRSWSLAGITHLLGGININKSALLALPFLEKSPRRLGFLDDLLGLKEVLLCLDLEDHIQRLIKSLVVGPDDGLLAHVDTETHLLQLLQHILVDLLVGDFPPAFIE
jgi:hypothetical protein